MFEFKVALNDDDYLNFCEYVLENRENAVKNIKKHIIMYHIAFAIAFFLSPLLVDGSADVSFQFYPVYFIFLLISCSIWLHFAEKLIPFYSKRKMKTLKTNLKAKKKKGKLPYSHEEVTFEFYDEKFYRKSHQVVNEISYSMLKKVVITETAVYLYYYRDNAFVLPLRVCSDDEEKQRFLEFITSKYDCIIAEK